MARSDLEHRADQLRSQIENLRQSLDDVLSSYNRLLGVGTDVVSQAQAPVASAARTVRSSVEDMTDALPSVGRINWWIPVAVVGAIGAAIWVFNAFFADQAQELGDQFSQTAQQVGTQMSQTAQQVGNQVSQTAEGLQSQFTPSNPTRDQLGSNPSGGSMMHGRNQTTFGEQR